MSYGDKLEAGLRLGAARQAFLDALDRLTDQGCSLSHGGRATDHAPKVIAEAGMTGEFTRAELAAAMNGLLNSCVIRANETVARRLPESRAGHSPGERGGRKCLTVPQPLSHPRPVRCGCVLHREGHTRTHLFRLPRNGTAPRTGRLSAPFRVAILRPSGPVDCPYPPAPACC
jgi:hypothetical protein